MRISMCYNVIVEKRFKSEPLLSFSIGGGSPALIRRGRADAVRPLRYYWRIMAKDFSKPFYNSPEWQKIRQAVLMRDKYLCVKCGRPAEEVHHKIHLTPWNIGDPKITMDMNNLVSLCRDCHCDEHRKDRVDGLRKNRDEYPYEFDANGMLIEKRNNPPVMT